MADLPEPTLALEVEETREFSLDDASLTALVEAESLPTAIGWGEVDSPVWSNDDAAYSIASITKLVTVLVGQEAEPLGVGEDGPNYTWSVEDQQIQNELLALNGVAFPVPVGTEMTRRQMLNMALIPSANDFAISYAYSNFGDRAGFIAAVDDWADRHDLASVEIHEPSGMDSENRASAADIVRIVRLVLADPVLAEIVATEHFTAPWGIGEVTTTNPLFDLMDGVVGAKTGTTDAAGYNLAGAASGEFEGRALTRISAVLSRNSYDARALDSVRLLEELDPLPETVEFVATGEPVGTLTSVDGQVVHLVTDGEASAVLVPGETATRTISADATSIAVVSPAGETEIPVIQTSEFIEPDLWWRITNPSLVFGWA